MIPADSRGRIRKRDAACFLFFVFFWIVPCAYQGLMGGGLPFGPRELSYLTNVSCLFTLATPFTPFDYIQIQVEAGGEWVTIPDAPYFRFSPFGYRTRLDEYMRHGLFDGRVPDEFAEWFRWRYGQLHPDRPPLAGVRLVAAIVPTTLVAPAGRWRKPPLEAIPPGVPRVWFTRTFRN
jgi:hypothetical protein